MNQKLPYPDFIIGGAPKCGTTALWHFLNQHPDVCMGSIKEPRFFTRVKGDMEKSITGNGPRLSGNYDKGFQWYASLFKNCSFYQKTGEASTVYFCNEDSAKLIYETKPDIKLIFMFRHPAKRMYSHYWQEHKLGFNFPSFGEMLETDHCRMQYYKRVSHYKANLQRYFKFFGREQILIVIQEEFDNNPETNFKKVLDFLRLQPVAINLNERFNEQVIPKSRRLALLLNFIKYSNLEKIIPHSFLRSMNKVRRQVIKSNTLPLSYPPMPADLFNSVTASFKEDIEYIEDILNRPIDFWKSGSFKMPQAH